MVREMPITTITLATTIILSSRRLTIPHLILNIKSHINNYILKNLTRIIYSAKIRHPERLVRPAVKIPSTTTNSSIMRSTLVSNKNTKLRITNSSTIKLEPYNKTHITYTTISPETINIIIIPNHTLMLTFAPGHHKTTAILSKIDIITSLSLPPTRINNTIKEISPKLTIIRIIPHRIKHQIPNPDTKLRLSILANHDNTPEPMHPRIIVSAKLHAINRDPIRIKIIKNPPAQIIIKGMAHIPQNIMPLAPNANTIKTYRTIKR